jgi:hypothetical protein
MGTKMLRLLCLIYFDLFEDASKDKVENCYQAASNHSCRLQSGPWFTIAHATSVLTDRVAFVAQMLDILL